MDQRIAVSSADFIRNIGRWQQEALQQPIVITHHGRERLVLAAPERFRLDAANEGSLDTDASREVHLAHAALLAHMEEGCLTFFPDGRIESANAAAAEFLGYAETELRGRTLTGVLSDLTSLIVMDRVQRVFRSRAAEQFEVDTSDGWRLCFHAYASGRSVTLLFRNVTEQVRLQRHLDENAGLEKALRSHSEIAIIKLDVRGRIEQVDDPFCSWTGFSASELFGHRLGELAPGEERRNVSQFIERLLRDGVVDQLKLDLLGRSGSAVHCAVTMAPIVAEYVPSGIVALAVRTA